MIGKLEFNLPEEQEQFEDAQNGSSYRYVLLAIDEWARRHLKHGHPFKVTDDVLETLRDKIREELDDLPL